jgi:GT2 family glycosyltransferase
MPDGGRLVTRKDVFLGAAGFDEKLLIAFNDVDLCVRLRSAKWRLIWTPASAGMIRPNASRSSRTPSR